MLMAPSLPFWQSNMVAVLTKYIDDSRIPERVLGSIRERPIHELTHAPVAISLGSFASILQAETYVLTVHQKTRELFAVKTILFSLIKRHISRDQLILPHRSMTSKLFSTLEAFWKYVCHGKSRIRKRKIMFHK